ncbi:MAG: hypothetical protein HY815_05760 [Candidatus Riflebacteria bacterium]|nr:hypothetical protein [Candidatus Riflebacteria bacterium]
MIRAATITGVLVAGWVVAAASLVAQTSPAHGPILMKEEAGRAYRKARDDGARLFSSGTPLLSTNGMTCAACHGRPGDLAGTFQKYPRYRRALGRFLTLEEQIGRCVTGKMQGRAPRPGSTASAALLVYRKELSTRATPTNEAAGGAGRTQARSRDH